MKWAKNEKRGEIKRINLKNRKKAWLLESKNYGLKINLIIK